VTDEARSEGTSRRTIGVRTATGLVVASMIGTGVYTTTGLLLQGGRSPMGVLAIWLAAGLLSLAGALSYAELAVAYPESGGEYALLGRVYHPAVGFVAGVVSLVGRVAAPIAACGIAFASYAAAVIPGLPEVPVAIGVVVLVSVFHALSARGGVHAQDALTAGKLALAVLFVVLGLFSPHVELARLTAVPFSLSEATSGGFAYGLVLVSFAYTGWNAAIYVGGELERPHRTLPLALALGTLAVTVLYLALNLLFLIAAPVDELAVVEVAHVAALHLFGERAAAALSMVIAFGLLSTIGAFVLTGARVYEALGRDHTRLAALARHGERGTPSIAFAIQAAIAVLMIVTSSFDTLLGAVGVTLSLSSALTVLGVFVVRRRATTPGPYRTPGHPITPIAFVALSLWTIVWAVLENPSVAIWGSLALVVGAVGYLLVRRRNGSPHRA
jgi:basic amino acid/polyamine antiporter, APA family